MSERIYLDNSATSFPKPPSVHQAMMDYAQQIGASAGRGAYDEAQRSGEIIARCRRRLAELFHASQPESFAFTLNATDALNMAIKGLLRPGDHAITTWLDHNSVLRPLNALQARSGVEVTFVECDPQTGLVDPESIRRAIRSNTRLVAVVHASNVTGTIQPIHQIGEIAHAHGALFVVDAAQSVGHLPIDVQALPVDAMGFPGHKALLGPLGTGVLYVRPGLDAEMQTIREGGTGSLSEQPTQPTFLPDRFEAGSHNAIGIAGLDVGLAYLLDRGIEALRSHERNLSKRLMDRIDGIDGLTWYGPRRLDDRVGVFSVRVDGFEPAELSAALESHFGILTRSGLHCAPLAHRTIGTYDSGGTTRVSFGAFTTPEHVDRVADALRELAAVSGPVSS
jgi:cysteine desulfurase/selenocysteine lyase